MSPDRSKAMTLRISNKQHSALTWLAKLNRTSVAEEVRRAIAEHIEARRCDPEFQARLREYRAEQDAVLGRLMS